MQLTRLSSLTKKSSGVRARTCSRITNPTSRQISFDLSIEVKCPGETAGATHPFCNRRVAKP
jgi:hypothetical protein